MPYALTPKRTPQGRDYVEALASGTIDVADANFFNDNFRTGGQYAGRSVLAIMTDDSKYTVEGRKALISGKSDVPVMAVVVTSAPLRVMLNFMLKASVAAASITGNEGPPMNVRSFNKGGDALDWLDGELAKKAS
jgi:hypothetical protein